MIRRTTGQSVRRECEGERAMGESEGRERGEIESAREGDREDGQGRESEDMATGRVGGRGEQERYIPMGDRVWWETERIYVKQKSREERFTDRILNHTRTVEIIHFVHIMCFIISVMHYRASSEKSSTSSFARTLGPMS